METCTFVPMEAELSPGAMEEWLSTVKDGNKCDKKKRRLDLSIKVKKHLSALGWVFSYFHKGDKRELRYKSPKGRWYYSLATACMSCLDQDSRLQHQQQQQQSVPNYDLSCSSKDLSSESCFDEQKQEKERCRVEGFGITSTAPEKENHSSGDMIKILPKFDESNLQQKKKIMEECDTTAACNVDQEKIRTVLSVDVLNQQQEQQQQTIPRYDLSCSPQTLSLESSFDVSNQEQKQEKKRCRVEDFDIISTTPEKENHPSHDLIKIVPNFDESNQQQKKKIMEDCDMTAACNVDQEEIETVLSVCVLNQEQQTIPTYVLPCSPKKLSLQSSFDVSHQEQKQEKKWCRVDVLNQQHKKRRCRVDVLNQQQTIPIYDLPCSPKSLSLQSSFDVSNQEQKQEKKRCRVDVLNQQQKKRRKTAREKIRRPRKGKPPTKISQEKRKNQQKNKREKESLRFRIKDPHMNCDVCCVCHRGGKLLLCDSCPSAFHRTCLGLSSLPDEDLWFCPCCCCDWCGLMESPANSKLMTCDQCQRRFHLNCLDEETCIVSCRNWFCSSQCDRVFSALQNLLGCKVAVGDGGDLVWTLMRAPNEDEHCDDEQISKIESAVKILCQGVEPTEDLFSGRDLVEELIFMRDRSGVSRGFYMVVIERKNEPVMVAAMRLDKDVAEIPLVASLSNYRNSGMCRVLMDELEKQISQMGVCRLVLPAAEEAVTTWTQQFGFSVMKSSERLDLVKHGMLDFVGTVMCHKFLLKEKKRR